MLLRGLPPPHESQCEVVCVGGLVGVYLGGVYKGSLPVCCSISPCPSQVALCLQADVS